MYAVLTITDSRTCLRHPRCSQLHTTNLTRISLGGVAMHSHASIANMPCAQLPTYAIQREGAALPGQSMAVHCKIGCAKTSNLGGRRSWPGTLSQLPQGMPWLLLGLTAGVDDRIAWGRTCTRSSLADVWGVSGQWIEDSHLRARSCDVYTLLLRKRAYIYAHAEHAFRLKPSRLKFSRDIHERGGPRLLRPVYTSLSHVLRMACRPRASLADLNQSQAQHWKSYKLQDSHAGHVT